ncbi:MAG: hypothetical protein HZB52_12275 [Chloroflexi bacterium]|nr:hypothetical protein [Chloroflexota bacterium]
MSHKISKRQMLRQRHTQKISPPLLLSLVGGVIVIGVILFAIFGNAPAPQAAIEVNGAPRLKVDKEKVELGDRTLGSEVEVSLEVTNVGDQPLRFAETPYVEVVEGC